MRFFLKFGPNPISGLIVVKFLAILLGVYCWRMGRQRLLSRINVMFAMVIAWNLVALIEGSGYTADQLGDLIALELESH